MGSLTPRLSLPYPALTDVADGPASFQALAVALDRAAIDDQGAFSARPVSTPGTPGIKGRYYWATDQTILYRDNGLGWDQVTMSAPVDPDQTVPGLRTLGTGHQQACAGDDPRLSDQRTPLDNSVTGPKVHTSLKPSGGAASSTEALRALGYGPGQAAAGIHSPYHQPTYNGGVDPIDYTKVNLFGTNNQRIARTANTAPGLFWYETDTQDLYYSDGTAWYRVVQHSLAGPTYMPIASFPPSSPADGQELYLKIDARTVWHVRYEAAEPTQYKWKCIGRQEPMYANSSGSIPLSASAIAVCQVQLPRSGEYRLEAGGVFDRAAASNSGTHLNLGTGIGGIAGIQGEGWLDATGGHTAQTVEIANDYAPSTTGQSAAAYAYGVTSPADPGAPVNIIKAWMKAFPLRLS
jgi:hypothetical protein